MDEAEKKKMFDVDSAALLVKELRANFGSGKTKSYGWRVSQMKNIIKMIEDHENDFVEALRSDLSKPELESFVFEVRFKLFFNFISLMVLDI